jgi:tripartite-type tricarboxylate transporter receptor subunit TctC
MRRTRLHVLTLTALIFILISAAIVRAQDYPVRTVTIIVPFATGGSTDTLAHLLAPRLGTRPSLQKQIGLSIHIRASAARWPNRSGELNQQLTPAGLARDT